MKNRQIFLITFISILITGLSTAEMYKYVDENGVLHFQDHPPEDVNIEKDKAAALRKKKLDSGRGVPFAVVNGRKISGFNPKAYENAMKKP